MLYARTSIYGIRAGMARVSGGCQRPRSRRLSGRFTRIGSNVDRVRTVLEEGRQAINPSKQRPVFAVAIAPSEPGAFLIDAYAVKHAEERVREVDFVLGEAPFEKPWAGLLPPVVSVGQRRLRIGTPDRGVGSIRETLTRSSIWTAARSLVSPTIPCSPLISDSCLARPTMKST